VVVFRSQKGPRAKTFGKYLFTDSDCCHVLGQTGLLNWCVTPRHTKGASVNRAVLFSESRTFVFDVLNC
jgi:hypothetical protein